MDRTERERADQRRSSAVRSAGRGAAQAGRLCPEREGEGWPSWMRLSINHQLYGQNDPLLHTQDHSGISQRL